MRSETNKKWGTIYLGGNKEATLESIDAMQSAARQEQWSQRTQSDYLDRVRERATDRAREILGAAHTERQNLLLEARSDAERIRLETQVQYDKADKTLADAEAIRAEAKAIRTEAEVIRNAAQEEGFNTGLANARDELDAFRGAMGSSIAVVLQSIERQNATIFAAWREEVVGLVQTCVGKGTEWVLQDQHAAVLRALVMESVRQLDNRHMVTLRVHPDDEAAVADMFAAAREAMPDVDRWIVQGDATVALGGLIAESPSSTVDNRVALRTALVEGILQHLILPESEAEGIAAQTIHEVVDAQVAHITELAPPVPESLPAQDLPPEPEYSMEQFSEQDAEQDVEQDFAQDAMPAMAPLVTDDLPDVADMPHETDMAEVSNTPEMQEMPNMADMPAMSEPHMDDIPHAPHADAMPYIADTPPPPLPSPHPMTTSLAELEEELLPLPPENSAAVDAVLAGGGFLSDDDNVEQRP